MTCSSCRKECQAIICNSNIEASEHYCANCHKSYDLTSSEMRQLVMSARSQESRPAEPARAAR